MDTPGYDPVSATGQVAGGANLICFTTGRGSAYGCKPVPSIKLATNSDIYRRMIDDMDINCGDVLVFGRTRAGIFARSRLLERTPNRELGYGDMGSCWRWARHVAQGGLDHFPGFIPRKVALEDIGRPGLTGLGIFTTRKKRRQRINRVCFPSVSATAAPEGGGVAGDALFSFSSPA
jgi:hypothetical protein